MLVRIHTTVVASRHLRSLPFILRAVVNGTVHTTADTSLHRVCFSFCVASPWSKPPHCPPVRTLRQTFANCTYPSRLRTSLLYQGGTSFSRQHEFLCGSVLSSSLDTTVYSFCVQSLFGRSIVKSRPKGSSSTCSTFSACDCVEKQDFCHPPSRLSIYCFVARSLQDSGN